MLTHTVRSFQLTRSRGAWRRVPESFVLWYLFQLTRSRGAWPADCWCEKLFNDFNSHAHVERDIASTVSCDTLCISTHTLTWSVTTLLSVSGSRLRFQLTRSRGAWLSQTQSRDIRDWFQLTRSRGAWRKIQIQRYLHTWFQLTRSRGAWHFPTVADSARRGFQLTRSRGAWPLLFKWATFSSGISTHTLTWSVTWVDNGSFPLQNISTHTLTWSVTSAQRQRSWMHLFQLTRSRGAWRVLSQAGRVCADFNSHAHVERDELMCG